MEIYMKCDHCGEKIVFGDDFYYKTTANGTKHFCSEECFNSDETKAVYYGLATQKENK